MGSRPTLRTLILENEARTTTSARGSTPAGARRSESSYAEKYRGTEYESPVTALPAPAPAVSRGRTAVLVAGTTVIATLVAVLTTVSA